MHSSDFNREGGTELWIPVLNLLIVDVDTMLLETNIQEAEKALAMGELKINPIMFYTSGSDQPLFAGAKLLDFLADITNTVVVIVQKLRL